MIVRASACGEWVSVVSAVACRRRELSLRLHPLPNPSPVKGEGLYRSLGRSRLRLSARFFHFPLAGESARSVGEGASVASACARRRRELSQRRHLLPSPSPVKGEGLYCSLGRSRLRVSAWFFHSPLEGESTRSAGEGASAASACARRRRELSQRRHPLPNPSPVKGEGLCSSFRPSWSRVSARLSHSPLEGESARSAGEGASAASAFDLGTNGEANADAADVANMLVDLAHDSRRTVSR